MTSASLFKIFRSAAIQDVLAQQPFELRRSMLTFLENTTAQNYSYLCGYCAALLDTEQLSEAEHKTLENFSLKVLRAQNENA